MDFSTEFFWNSLRGAGFALIFFSLPGLWTALLLGLRINFSALFIAPVLGLCVYGPFSLLFTWLIGYSVITIIVAWILFQGGVALIYFKYVRRTHSDLLFDQTSLLFLSVPVTVWLLLAAALWALLPTFNIYPMVYQDGLFVNWHIFDHMKIAFIDGIAREGLPPMNPFYAPAGERIPLIYYYTWHFLGAQIKSLSGVSGWQAEVVLTWFTSFATVAFLAALAIRISGRLWAGFALLLLGLAGSPADILPQIMGARWERWIGMPPVHPLEVLWVQLSWAPQHVFAALSSVLLLFLITRALVMPHLRWSYAGIIGLTTAVGFGASVWVGGLALVFVLPALLLVLWRLRLDYTRWWAPLLFALAVCVIFVLPVLSSIISGPSVADGFPLKLTPYYASGLFGYDTLKHIVGHIIMFWPQFLPLTFGVVYVLGLFAVIVYTPLEKETRIFKYLSMAAIISYLLVVQWVQSTIGNNDFGWRTAVVPFMLLLIWAAAALAEMPSLLSRWHGRARLRYVIPIVVPLIWIGITVGMLSSFRSWVWPQPHSRYNPPSPQQLALHQSFFRHREAWIAVSRHTGPSDIVQNNPDTYATVVTAWPTPAPVFLFGDRPVAYGDPVSVFVFAHPYDKAQKDVQKAAVEALFMAEPEPTALVYARDTLKIRALIVDPRDPVWNSQAIENSGIYRLVESTEQFKIYLANLTNYAD